jgi:hypothetical protein
LVLTLYDDLTVKVASGSNNDCRKATLNFASYLQRDLQPPADAVTTATPTTATTTPPAPTKVTSELFLETALELFQQANEQFTDFVAELLQEDEGGPLSPPPCLNNLSAASTTSPLSISVMYSHHIIAKSKLALIPRLARNLQLTGCMLKGWPGAIVVEGPIPAIDEFLVEMKKLSWKRFVERGRIDIEQRVFGTTTSAPSSFPIHDETKAFSSFVRQQHDAIGAQILSLAFGH